MSFGGFEHLLSPLVGGDFLTALINVFGELGEQRNLRSDPNILAYINNRIRDYNANTAFNPETGQYNAGSPFGDAASGHGGAYGRDNAGNPLSPFQANTRYTLGQLNASQDGLDTGASNLAAAASAGGVAAPRGYDLGISGLGLDPGAVQGVDQSVRRPPARMTGLEPPGGWLNTFLGGFQTGTRSVPATGLAVLHQGEAVVPRELNPGALPPGVPGAPMTGGGGLPQAAPSGPQAAPSGGGAMPPPRAVPTASPGGYLPLSPGLNPQVQQQIVQQGNEGINRQYQALERDLRNTGPQGGGGVVDRRLFDAELARRGALADHQRTVGIEAANRQFTDSLAANEFLLGQELGRGNLALGQGRLGLDQELGRGQLANDTLLAQLQQELGRGNLALGQGRLSLDQELGRGQLGQGQQALDLERLLGTGRLDLERTLGLGQLGQGQQALDLERLLGTGRLDLERTLGLGQLGQGQQALDLERLLGTGRLANEGRSLDIQEGLGHRGLDIEQMLAQLQQELGRGNLALGQGELARGLANDAFGQYQWGQGRNDALAQQDFENQLQQYVLSQQQNQFGDLLGLFGQFSGQTQGQDGGGDWLAQLLGQLFGG